MFANGQMQKTKTRVNCITRVLLASQPAYAEPREFMPDKSSTSLLVKEIRQLYNGKVVVGHDLDIY